MFSPSHSTSSAPRAGSIISAGVGVAAGLGSASLAHASFVYSGVVSIEIPASADGIFLDLNTGSFGSSRDAIAGWDLNIYGVGTLMIAGQGDLGMMAADGTSSSLIDNLQFRDAIGSESSFASGPLGVETSGSTAFNFNSSQNLIGFRFRNMQLGGYSYGWMRLQLAGADFGQPKAIFEYLWETTPGTWTHAGVIPAPGAMALIAGAASLPLRRWRRRA
jgi:hypothetical protein